MRDKAFITYMRICKRDEIYYDIAEDFINHHTQRYMAKKLPQKNHFRSWVLFLHKVETSGESWDGMWEGFFEVYKGYTLEILKSKNKI